MEGVLRAKPLSRTGSEKDSYNPTGSLMKTDSWDCIIDLYRIGVLGEVLSLPPDPVTGLWLIQTLCSHKEAWPQYPVSLLGQPAWLFSQ